MKCNKCPCKDIPCITEETGLVLYCDRLEHNNDLAYGILKSSQDYYTKKNNPEDIPEPSLVNKGVNLVKAIGKVVDHVVREKTVEINVTQKVYEARLEICNQPCLFNNNMTCVHPDCGCDLTKKALLKTEDCPVGLWPKEQPSMVINNTGKCGGCGQKGK